jgi:hypothetical protein
MPGFGDAAGRAAQGEKGVEGGGFELLRLAN